MTKSMRDIMQQQRVMPGIFQGMRLDLSPESMSADERDAEITTILAQGLVRLLTSGSDTGQLALTGSAMPSDECASDQSGLTRRTEGGTACRHQL